jgi:WD40 repeat protein
MEFAKARAFEKVHNQSGLDSVPRCKLFSLSCFHSCRTPQDVEPIFSFRGHTAPITAVVFGAGSHPDRFFTSSLDSTIREWKVPPLSRDIYAPYGVLKVSICASIKLNDAY